MIPESEALQLVTRRFLNVTQIEQRKSRTIYQETTSWIGSLKRPFRLTR